MKISKNGVWLFFDSKHAFFTRTRIFLIKTGGFWGGSAQPGIWRVYAKHPFFVKNSHVSELAFSAPNGGGVAPNQKLADFGGFCTGFLTKSGGGGVAQDEDF